MAVRQELWRDARLVDYRPGCARPHQLTIGAQDTILSHGRADVRGTKNLERETGFEPATSTLARSHSTN